MQFPARNPNNPDDIDGTITIDTTDPELTTLADHSGSTQTITLNSGSPALDSAIDSTDPSMGRLGFARPVDGETIPLAVIVVLEYAVSGEFLPPTDSFTLHQPMVLRP